MNYKKNNKYFASFEVFLYCLALWFGLLFLVVAKLFGFIFLVVIGVLWFRGHLSKPTDAEIDEIVLSQRKALRTRAINRLGVDEDEVNEAPEIVIGGYIYNRGVMNNLENTFQYVGTVNIDEYVVKVKQGKDGKYRSSLYQAGIILFSKDEIYCYSCVFSIISNKQQEFTAVISYKDVATVSSVMSSTDYKTSMSKRKQVDYGTLVLTATGGSAFNCVVENGEDIQNTIKDIRTLVKRKKLE